MTLNASQRPVIGAAMNIDEISIFDSFLRSKNRDLELQDFISADVLDLHFDEYVENAKSALKGYEGRIGLHGPFKGIALDCPDPLLRSAVQSRILKSLEAAECLNATHLVLHSPATFWGHFNQEALPKLRPMTLERTTTLLKPILQRASEIGCVIMLENIEDVDPSLHLDLVKAMDSPWIKASVDTGHAHCAMGFCRVDSSVQAYVSVLGDALCHLHLHDNDGSGDFHRPPGAGTIDWPALMRTIAGSCHPDTRYILELRDRKQLLKAVNNFIEMGLGQ